MKPAPALLRRRTGPLLASVLMLVCGAFATAPLADAAQAQDGSHTSEARPATADDASPQASGDGDTTTEGSESGSEADAASADAASADPASADAASDEAKQRSPDVFEPSEEISEDLSVAYPVDI